MVDFEFGKTYLYTSPLNKFIMVFEVLEPRKTKHFNEWGIHIKVIYSNQDFPNPFATLSERNAKMFLENSIELTL